MRRQGDGGGETWGRGGCCGAGGLCLWILSTSGCENACLELRSSGTPGHQLGFVVLSLTFCSFYFFNSSHGLSFLPSICLLLSILRFCFFYARLYKVYSNSLPPPGKTKTIIKIMIYTCSYIFTKSCFSACCLCVYCRSKCGMT